MSWFSKHVIDPVKDVVIDPVVEQYERVGKEVGRTVDGVEVGDVIAAAAVINPALLISNLETITSGMTAYTQYEAGQAAKDEGQRAAEAEAATTAERVKIMGEENARKEALARARSAASGVSGASSEIYMDALAKTGREDIDWLKKVGESNYDAQIAAGQSAYSQAQAGMWSSIGGMIPGVGQTFSMFAGL